jgi:hypothetical protein
LCRCVTRSIPDGRAGDCVGGCGHCGGAVDVEVDAGVAGAVGSGEGYEDG